MNLEAIYNECIEIVKDPVKYMKNTKESADRKYIGYTCIFAPEEIIHAAGFVPVRIMGFAKRLIKSEKYITSNSCEFARNIIEFLASEDSNFLDGIVFPHCCDTIQVIADISSRFFEKNIFIFNVPTRIDTNFSPEYLRKIICEFKSHFEGTFGIEISEESISKSYEIYRENRRLVSKLYEIRQSKPGLISGYHSLAVVIAGLFMDKEKHNDILKNMIEQLELLPYKETTKNKILLSGILNCNIQTVEMIEECGCIVVDDDLCEGSRTFPRKDTGDFIFPDSIERAISLKFCPVKNYSDTEYHKFLMDRYNASKADAIMFFLFPFCDPQFLEYATIKRYLTNNNIKNLLIEVVAGTNVASQILTRVEAFLESL